MRKDEIFCKDILTNIYEFLEQKDIFFVSLVNFYFHSVIKQVPFLKELTILYADPQLYLPLIYKHKSTLHTVIFKKMKVERPLDWIPLPPSIKKLIIEDCIFDSLDSSSSSSYKLSVNELCIDDKSQSELTSAKLPSNCKFKKFFFLY